MDYVDQGQGHGAQALDRLCAAAAHELLMRSYTSRTLNRYKRVWQLPSRFIELIGRLYKVEADARRDELDTQALQQQRRLDI